MVLPHVALSIYESRLFLGTTTFFDLGSVASPVSSRLKIRSGVMPNFSIFSWHKWRNCLQTSSDRALALEDVSISGFLGLIRSLWRLKKAPSQSELGRESGPNGFFPPV